MVVQARKTILNEMVSQIDAAVAAFGSVLEGPLGTNDLSNSAFPVCIVWPVGGAARSNVTPTQEFDTFFNVQIVVDSSSTTDTLLDLDEAVVDAINADVTLNGSCIFCDVRDDDTMLWKRGSNKYILREYFVQYRRDFV